MLMTTGQKSSLGSESSIASIGSRINLECILNENCETTGVPLKVRKPYTISKLREKWSDEEHKRFIEALKLYGRAWRQIEEYIGTKSAVQIRSHAQKFFCKVMKEGACSAEASTEPVDIPPPRPKRKPLHPYPRKLVETPNKTIQFPTLLENGASTNMKTSDREVHSPITVLSPEGSQISTSHVKVQGNSYVSRTSSGSNLSHDVERETLIKDDSTQGKEKGDEENLSLTLHFSGPSLSTLMVQSAGKIMKDIKSTKDEYNCSDKWIKCVGFEGGSPIKSVKLFGRIMAVPDQSEYSNGVNDVVTHTATSNHFTELASKIDGYFSVVKRHSEKDSPKGFSCTESNSNSFNEVKNTEANLDSVYSKLEYKQQANANANNLNKGFYPYKRCFSDREAVYTPDDRESQRIRVYL